MNREESTGSNKFKKIKTLSKFTFELELYWYVKLYIGYRSEPTTYIEM